MRNLLLWIWQLPQHLLGLTLRAFLEDQRRYYDVSKFNDTLPYSVCHRIANMGVSLGSISILGYRSADDKNTIRHECIGHAKQSQLLGPLYLLVIGLPSLIGNIYNRIYHKGSAWYYKQPWEAWADKLGGVVRK